MKISKGAITAVILLFLLLSACSAGKAKDKLTPEQVYTQAAQTVQAQLTQMSEGKTTATSEVEISPTLAVTKTPEQTSTPVPSTATQETLPTTPSTCTNRASFVSDVNYIDGAEVSPGAEFTKTWKMMNAGTCIWNINYKVLFINSDGITAPTETPLTTGIEVPAGAQININVSLKAPDAAGTYTAYFKFKAPDGTIFGINSDGTTSFYVKVSVVKATATVTMTPEPSQTPTPTPSS